jgi:hypothetical protein
MPARTSARHRPDPATLNTDERFRSRRDVLRRRPESAGPPVAEVDATVRLAFQRYNVVGFYADPSGWTEYVARWEAKYGSRLRMQP